MVELSAGEQLPQLADEMLTARPHTARTASREISTDVCVIYYDPRW